MGSQQNHLMEALAKQTQSLFVSDIFRRKEHGEDEEEQQAETTLSQNGAIIEKFPFSLTITNSLSFLNRRGTSRNIKPNINSTVSELFNTVGDDSNNPSNHQLGKSSSSLLIGGGSSLLPSASVKTPSEFDMARREAKNLQRHLEDRVAQYQQLAQQMTLRSDSFFSHSRGSFQKDGLERSLEAGTFRAYSKSNDSDSDTRSDSQCKEPKKQPATNTDLDFDAQEESFLRSDIERTLSALSDLVNNALSEAAETTSGRINPNRTQNVLRVQRFREILLDVTADYKKTSLALRRRNQATELFAKRDGNDSGSPTEGNGTKGFRDQESLNLLRERHSIGKSLKTTFEIIGQAEEIRKDLRQQGMSVNGVQGRVQSIAGRMPGINHLMKEIRKKRNRDGVIISAVISMCILFKFWYVFG